MSGMPASCPSRSLMRFPSCCAAFRVKVRPNTWSGSMRPLATSHTTRAAMVSVLPAPAPATTSMGPRSACITVACCSVGGYFCPSSLESSMGSMSTKPRVSLAYDTLVVGSVVHFPVSKTGQMDFSLQVAHRGFRCACNSGPRNACSRSGSWSSNSANCSSVFAAWVMDQMFLVSFSG